MKYYHYVYLDDKGTYYSSVGTFNDKAKGEEEASKGKKEESTYSFEIKETVRYSL